MKKLIVFFISLAISTLTYSEDIELYVSASVKNSAKKPQVLIIFDNSGSMNATALVKEGYNPATTYEAEGSLHAFQDRAIYYTKGSLDNASLAVPDSSNDARRFLDDTNNCTAAITALNTTGFYVGRMKEFVTKGKSGSWQDMPDNNGLNIEVLDCEDDVRIGNDENTGINPTTKARDHIDGYPTNGLSSNKNGIVYYGTKEQSEASVEWNGSMVTLYTANYLRWYHWNPTDEEKNVRSRLDIAKDSITSVINSTPSVEFGLQLFNLNAGDGPGWGDGGRVISSIKDMTPTNKAGLLNIVNSDDLVAVGATPLCESLYEASLYFAGKKIEFADDDINYKTRDIDYKANKPPRDETIEISEVYQTPYQCNKKVFVILITDGLPTYDNAADSKIEGLTATEPDEDGNMVTNTFSGSKYVSPVDRFGNKLFVDNYLPALAGWMNKHDLNANIDGVQTADIFPIGFVANSDDDSDLDIGPILQETAIQGNEDGKFFIASSQTQLVSALVDVLNELDASNESLTSASVAANNFDRTETLNSVYYAMFEPEYGPRWQGNLKKYKVEKGIQVGQEDNIAAVDEDTGHFSENVTSFWSASGSKDGTKVAEGGVAEMLRTKSNRTIYSDLGDNKLTLLTKENAITSFGTSTKLAEALRVEDTTEKIDEMLNWAKGIDVDDENKDGSKIDIRYDIFGDPLHSKPLVVNYGNNNIRILIGTNAGVLHMFEDKNDVVDELWAFMPKEFFSKYKTLRDNYSSDSKVYGIDGRITQYVNDKDGDGIIEAGDEVWVFFGLRRGGHSYYALDISDPSSTPKPELLWHISNNGDFSELGQTWSQPKVAFSKLNATDETASPVVIFGGGYAISKDSKLVPSADAIDAEGKAIYMVDAKTGAFKWSLAPSGSTAFSGKDGIASSIATLDSDGDGFVDRLYAGDTGGKVWRVDMPGNNTGEDKWTVFELASLGGNNLSNDRRFFNEPSIVRTFITETEQTTVTTEEGSSVIVRQTEKPYDAILIGSGDRTNPLGTDTQDTFFMIKDQNINSQSFSSSSQPPTPQTIEISDLYDLTNSPFDTITDDTLLQSEAIKLSNKDGWFISFSSSNGEKNSSTAIAINGIAYFTSYIPPGTTVVNCEVPGGIGRLYAVGLAQAKQIYNWKKDDVVTAEDRYIDINKQFLDSPTVIVLPEDDNDATTVDEAVGNIIVGRQIIPIGFQLQTLRTHLYITEDE